MHSSESNSSSATARIDCWTQRIGSTVVGHVQHARGSQLELHAHDRASLHVVLDGVYEERVEGRSQEFTPGAILFKPAGTEHDNAFRNGSKCLRFELDPAESPHLLPSRWCEARADGDARVAALASRLCAELACEEDGLPRDSLGAEVLGLCVRSLTGARTERAARRAARAAAGWLRAELQDPPSMTQMAEELGVERSALAHAFRSAYGCSMGDYLRRLRVEFVAHELRRSSRPLSELALSAGFTDQAHLCRWFRRVVGATPAEYRRCIRHRGS